MRVYNVSQETGKTIKLNYKIIEINGKLYCEFETSDVGVFSFVEYDTVFDKTDSNSLVNVQAQYGVFPVDTEVVTTKTDQNKESEYQKVLHELDNDIKSNSKNIIFYDINILNFDGNYVQPDNSKGTVKVRLPIESNIDPNYMNVYRVLSSDGDDVKLDYNVVTIDDVSYCEFQTDHFSLYALVEIKSNNFNWIILIALIFLVLLAILLIYRKYLKRRSN